MTRWLEDTPLDEPIDLGRHRFDRDEAAAFAGRYEPSPRGDDAVVSGWQVALTGHRMMLQAMFAEDDALRAAGQTPGEAGPAPGVDEIAFLGQVRAGETISFSRVLTGKRMSKSLPGWGLLSNVLEGRNEAGIVVYRTRFAHFVRARPAGHTALEGRDADGSSGEPGMPAAS